MLHPIHLISFFEFSPLCLYSNFVLFIVGFHHILFIGDNLCQKLGFGACGSFQYCQNGLSLNILLDVFGENLPFCIDSDLDGLNIDLCPFELGENLLNSPLFLISEFFQKLDGIKPFFVYHGISFILLSLNLS